MDWGLLFGRTAGVLSLIGLLVYARSMIVWPPLPARSLWFLSPPELLTYLTRVAAADKKPSRATWFIWTLNSFLLLPSYSASGAEETVWFAAGYTAGCFIIALLTVKFGQGGWNRLDRCCLTAAVLGALLWRVTGSALTMFVITLVIDLIGVLPTIKKSWEHPGEEDLLAWSILLLGGLVGLLAVREWSITVLSFTVMAYPLQITITTTIIILFLVRPQARQMEGRS